VLSLAAASCGAEESTFTTDTLPPSSVVTGAPTTSAPPAGPDPGAAWSRISGDEATFAGADLRSVAAAGPGVVAVGYDDAGGDRDAAVWLSADGLTWQRVPHDEAVFGGPGDQEPTAVASAGPGVVAVGYDDAGGDRDAAVWVSTDGLTWQRVPHDDAVLGGPGAQGMLAVASGGPGVVAVGYDDAGGDRDAAVWVSTDGLAWQRIPNDAAVFGAGGVQEASGVAAGAGRLVAVGYDDAGGDRDAAVWVSTDGVAWERVPHDEAVFGGPGFQMAAAVAAGTSGFAAGGTDDPDGDLDAAMWASADGLTWQRVPHDEAVFGGPDFQVASGVAAAGPGFVTVGIDYSGGDRDGAVWVSADGLTWARVPHDEAVFGGPDAQRILGVAATAVRLVAVGSDWSGRPAGAVWVSPPGP